MEPQITAELIKRRKEALQPTLRMPNRDLAAKKMQVSFMSSADLEMVNRAAMIWSWIHGGPWILLGSGSLGCGCCLGLSAFGVEDAAMFTRIMRASSRCAGYWIV